MYHEEFDASQPWFIILETITLSVLLTFTILSFFLYFLEIQIILSFRKTTFKGPFFRLMLVGILVDMISAVNLFTGQVIPAKGWFVAFLLKNQNHLGKIFFFITYGGRCIQGATAAILSFCRVFAVKSLTVYRKLNEPHSIYTMQAIQLVGALVAGVMLIPDTYEYIYENQGYYSVGSDDTDADWFYAFVALLEVFFVVCIVVNNLITYITFHLRFRKKSKTTVSKLVGNLVQSTSKERQKRESSLDKMTFIVCCVEIIYFAFVVYSLQINQSMNKRVFYFLYNILCVVYSTFSAWMLLIVSKPITMEFKQKFSGIGQKRTRSVSISVQGSGAKKF